MPPFRDDPRDMGQREQAKNRAESSHVPVRRRERKQQGFKSLGSAQRFLSMHAATYNTFDVQPATIDPSGTFPPALTPRCKR